VLASRAADRMSAHERVAFMHKAAQRLVATRPTNNAIRDIVTQLLEVVKSAARSDKPCEDIVRPAAEKACAAYFERSRRLGEAASDLVADGDQIFTHCWGESYLTETIAAALRSGKKVSAICTETRPYLQGRSAHRGESSGNGRSYAIITDGMAAAVMSRCDVAWFITAADRVTMDGHVINKVGTLQIAICAQAFHVPYMALIHAPDLAAPTPASVPIEYRCGSEVLSCLGKRTASRRATGLYPAFDVTPPRYVSVIATDRGRFAASDVQSYYELATKR
jgi:methylthioribose-1-phosphate isomerase